MGLPLTNASRLSEDNLPFNSDSKESIHSQAAKVNPPLAGLLEGGYWNFIATPVAHF